MTTTWHLNRHGCGAYLTQQLISSPRKKLLDEASFQQLLAAAYVLQQHNDSSSYPASSPSEILSEFVRVQRLIRSGHSGLVENAQMIAEQVQRFTSANGVAIGIATDDEVIYLAASGTASREIGFRVPSDSSLSSYCLRTGLTLQSLRTEDEPRMLFAVCSKADVKSFIGVPVSYENTVVGVLEARFKIPNAFRDEDVRTCELMAVLVKEVIAQAGQTKTAHEQPAVQEDFDQLPSSGVINILFAEDLPRPSQQFDPPVTVASESVTENSQVVQAPEMHELPPHAKVEPTTASSTELVSQDATPCRGCGQILASDESFCGNCGTERITNLDGPLQSKWASLWYMNQARKSAEHDIDAAAQDSLTNATEAGTSEAGTLDLTHPAQEVVTDIELTPDEQDAPASYDLVHSSAAIQAPSVRLEWLPEAASSDNWLSRQWRVNRANFYLAGAALLLIVVLSGWGTSPAMNPGAANSSGPQLTLFERMLVSLGVAEAPANPVYMGNPDTPVWVDLHTALYYCPGSDLYGKTDGGKIATQRSAQMDQFEPAHRKACN